MSDKDKAVPLPTSSAGIKETEFDDPQLNEGEEFASLTAEPDAPQGAAKDVIVPAAKADAPAPAPTEDVADGDDVPAELRGKTAKELAKMYANAQQLIGRHGQEIGELRKNTDALIRDSLARRNAPAPAAPKEEPKPVEDTDFFKDPKGTVERLVAEHPAVKQLRSSEAELRAATAAARAQANLEAFQRAHPDVNEIVADPEFRQWVDASPIRKDLLRRADQQYDAVAGNEIFSTWKAIKAAKVPAKPAEPVKPAPARAAAARAARVPTANSGAPSSDSGTKAAPQGKIFKRSEIVAMMHERPEEYARRADEIQRAYEENRVR